jgi:sugar transferase (PEP-CTERM/EpsH1 system associated)
MKILYLSHCLPYPPTKGDKLRAFHSVRHLARRHEVHLLSIDRAKHEADEIPALRRICATAEVFHLEKRRANLRAARALLGSDPLTLAYYRSPSFANRVREVARSHEVDVVMAYCSSMAPYAQLVEGVPRVIDLVDVDSAKWEQYSQFAPRLKRPFYSLEARRLRRYEAWIGASFDRVILSTSPEVERFAALAPEARVLAVRNGVDLDNFHPLALPKSRVPTLVFTGQMDYFPNVDGVSHFSQEVFPRLRRRYPDMEFLIVGRSPTLAVQKLGAIPGVSVTGFVVDVRPFLTRSWIFVAPLRIARGVQNKVLEAMAMQLPVVCHEQVMAGLADSDLEPGRDLLVAGDARGLERSIARLVDSEADRRRLGLAGRDKVARSYSWNRNMTVLDDVMKDLAPPAPLGASLRAPSPLVPVAEQLSAVVGEASPGGSAVTGTLLSPARRLSR